MLSCVTGGEYIAPELAETNNEAKVMFFFSTYITLTGHIDSGC
jgi:hypothetical protein